MIIYDNALGQFVLLNKHNYLSHLQNCLCFAQFELAMMDKMPATVAWNWLPGDMFYCVQHYCKKKKVIIFEFIDKTSNPEKQSPIHGQWNSFRLCILLIPDTADVSPFPIDPVFM